MKSSALGLAIAAIAFGASTIYLSVQLKEERTQADQVAETIRALNARIAELEKAREQRFVAGSFGEGALAQGGVPGALPGTHLEGRLERASPPSGTNLPLPPLPARTEAFQKMMRTQVRANYKRIYADLGTQLGLNKEDASKLIDMLTDQQVDSFARVRERGSMDPAEVKRTVEDARLEDQAELEAFLGASKMESLRDYQETIPARQEMDQLTRQLEGSDASVLSDEQQKRLLTAFIDERKRIPMPKPSDSTTTEDYMKAYTEWQSGYTERMNAQAQSILKTDQLTAYNEYQQWQKEMREQVAMRRQSRGQRIPGGDGGGFGVAAPIAGEAVMVLPPPGEEKPRKAP